MIDFAAINNAALPRCPSLLEMLLPGGRVQGREYVCSDLSGGDGSSLSVNMETGVWKDFATSDRGGDLISLVAATRGLSQGKAAKELANMVGEPISTSRSGKRSGLQEKKPTVIVPVPERTQEPVMKHPALGQPTAIYKYRDMEGRLLGYVCRFNKEEVGAHGKLQKEFRPLTWTDQGWQWQALPTLRPLYGLERLRHAASGTHVLVLEGEGKADAVYGILGPDMPVLSLNGGASGVEKIDYLPLKGLPVCYWPDADLPGKTAASVFLQRARQAGAASVAIVSPPDGVAEGWDAGDAVKEGWDRARLLALIKEHTVDQTALQEVNAQTKTQLTPQNEGTSSRDVELQSGMWTGINEESIATEFVAIHKEHLRYCEEFGSWFEWNDKRCIWVVDRTRRAYHYARCVCRTMNLTGKASLGSARTASGVEKFARADPIFATVSEQWDADPMVLGMPKSGLEKDHYLTKSTSVAPVAGRPHQWLEFLEQTTNGDKELQRFLQQICGYCLTGHTREHALFFIYGGGGNGKSVFVNTIIRIMGDYAVVAPLDIFTASNADRHPTDLAMLRGARLVAVSETEEGRAWAEAKIKALTGGDQITARFMRQNFFTYTPQFKIIVIGNHKPRLRNVNDAMRRRFNIIPFIHKPAIPDKHLEEKLKAEYPQILQWMLDGRDDWLQNGLTQPDIVKHATNDYFETQDLFGQWIEKNCETGSNKSEASGTLYGDWKKFAEDAEENPGSQVQFADNMDKRGFMRCRTKKTRKYEGIALRTKEINERLPYCDN